MNSTMMARTAAEALDRFERASKDDLARKFFYEGQTPRLRPSGILRVLGEELNGPSDCPPQIMPLWLAKAAGSFFDARLVEGAPIFPDDAAKTWGLKFYGELKRIDGKVPFSVIHDWHANTVGPLIVKVSECDEPNPWRGVDRPKALQGLHAAALAGRQIAAGEWRPVLLDAFRHIHANGRIGPAVTAARRYTLDETVAMNADAYANAYAKADAEAFAHTHWYTDARLDAYTDHFVDAYGIIQNHAKLLADPHPDYDRYNYLGHKHRCMALAHLADGLVESLARVTP
jgi:hypothetical protein